MAEPIIGIHLDLKGVVFRPDYVPRLMADLAGQGINTVLVEYEDVFPFKDIDLAFDPATRWSADDLQTFLDEAERHGIDVIPLQQCLGHLEYVFRWDRYTHLAEDRAYPSTVCLGKPEGKALVFDLLTQVIAAHPRSRYVHLGMDEAHALVTAAQRDGRQVIEVFIEFLEELLAITESHGKTAIIWSDMLEDHFVPGLFDGIKDRVVICTWDYKSTGERSPDGRIRGWRVSREWLDEPANPDAPPIGEGSRFFEDLPDEIREQVAPYTHGREMDTIFQVDLWTRLGFRVIGATAIRSSSHGVVLPRYLKLQGNIETFAKRIRDHDQLGLIGTSWARGNTFCPPNFPIEVAWPAVHVLGAAMGAKPQPFFPGIDDHTVQRILGSLSRCRDDWSIERLLADEMEELKNQLEDHVFEWEAMILMARTVHLHRRAEFSMLEVDAFLPSYRPVSPEWERRLHDQETIIEELRDLRSKLEDHFGRTNHGEHLREWVASLTEVWILKLQWHGEQARQRLNQARERYGW